MTPDAERIPSSGGGTHPAVQERVPGESAGKSAAGGVRAAGKVAVLVLLLVFLNYGMGWISKQIAFQMWPRHANMALTLLTVSVVAYVLLLAIPFLPGIEIGLMVMVLLGRPGIVLVYLATVLALTLSFLLGRLLSPESSYAHWAGSISTGRGTWSPFSCPSIRKIGSVFFFGASLPVAYPSCSGTGTSSSPSCSTFPATPSSAVAEGSGSSPG